MGFAIPVLLLVLASCVPAAPVRASPSAPGPTAVAGTPAASATAGATTGGRTAEPGPLRIEEFAVGRGQHPHDVAPAADGGVWYTAQATGELGHLDPRTGATRMVKLGEGSSPHGVIVGPDDAPWITDGGLNAIVRVDPATGEVRTYRLPADRGGANLNTAAFDLDGTLWFTGQSGVFGRLDPKGGAMAVFDAPRGRGPYGIATCPDGNVYYASLAGSYVGRVQRMTGGVEVLTPPTSGQGARRVWCDSRSRVWVAEWNAGRVARLDGAAWTEWKLPGSAPMAYAVFVDDRDVVWLTDFGANAIVRFDPATETFATLPHGAPNAAVRQLLGRPGEVWGAMSGQDALVVVRTR